MLRNLVRYLLLLFVVGLLSILYNTYYMTILFLTMAVLPLLMFALVSYLYGKVNASLVSVVHVVKKGEVVPVSVQLDNPTVFPISNIKLYITFRNAYSSVQYKKNFTVSIGAQTKASVICNLLSDYAGNLEISLHGFRIYDYMKLFSLKRKNKSELKVAILPEYYELPDSQFASRNGSLIESDYYSPYKSGDDPSEVFSIREYREGDRQQRIHWKLSLKQDQLMIKEFSDPMNCSVLLFVDLSMPGTEEVLPFMDSMLECTLSLSYTFLLAGQMHYLAWYDEAHGICRRIRIAQKKDLFEALDGLLQVRLYDPSVDSVSAYLAEHPKEQYTNLIFVSGVQPRKRLESLSLLRAFSRHIIYIGDIDSQPGTRYFPSEIIRRSDETGVTLSSVDTHHVQRDLSELRFE